MKANIKTKEIINSREDRKLDRKENVIIEHYMILL